MSHQFYTRTPRFIVLLFDMSAELQRLFCHGNAGITADLEGDAPV